DWQSTWGGLGGRASFVSPGGPIRVDEGTPRRHARITPAGRIRETCSNKCQRNPAIRAAPELFPPIPKNRVRIMLTPEPPSDRIVYTSAGNNETKETRR